MVDRGQDLGHMPEAQTGSASVPTERGSDRFIGQMTAIMLSAMFSAASIIMGGPAGERIARGLATVIAQEPSELVVRAWGNIGSGLGMLAGIAGSGIILYRILKR